MENLHPPAICPLGWGTHQRCTGASLTRVPPHQCPCALRLHRHGKLGTRCGKPDHPLPLRQPVAGGSHRVRHRRKHLRLRRHRHRHRGRHPHRWRPRRYDLPPADESSRTGMGTVGSVVGVAGSGIPNHAELARFTGEDEPAVRCARAVGLVGDRRRGHLQPRSQGPLLGGRA